MTDLANWTARLRGLDMGTGNYDLTGPITGLGVPGPSGNRIDYFDRDGGAAGLDVYPRRILTIPLGVNGDGDPETCWSLLKDLKVAWRKQPTGEEVLLLKMPGDETVTFFGRPQGLDPDLTFLAGGYVNCLGTFEATDPLMYGALIEGDPSAAGDIEIDSPTTEPTDRVVITITGNGEVPAIFSVTDQGVLNWAQPLADGQTRIIDVRARTVVDGDGNDRFGELNNGQLWWRIMPDENHLVFAQGGTCKVDHLPASI